MRSLDATWCAPHGVWLVLVVSCARSLVLEAHGERASAHETTSDASESRGRQRTWDSKTLRQAVGSTALCDVGRAWRAAREAHACTRDLLLEQRLALVCGRWDEVVAVRAVAPVLLLVLEIPHRGGHEEDRAVQARCRRHGRIQWSSSTRIDVSTRHSVAVAIHSFIQTNAWTHPTQRAASSS